MPCLVAIGDCAHVGSASAFFKDLVTVAQNNSTNQTSDILVENQLQPPLALVTVSKERELKPNSRTECESFFFIIHAACVLA